MHLTSKLITRAKLTIKKYVKIEDILERPLQIKINTITRFEPQFVIKGPYRRHRQGHLRERDL